MSSNGDGGFATNESLSISNLIHEDERKTAHTEKVNVPETAPKSDLDAKSHVVEEEELDLLYTDDDEYFKKTDTWSAIVPPPYEDVMEFSKT